MQDKKKILIVDDELDLVTLMKMRLEFHNYAVVPLYTSKRTIEIVEREKPDLILLDIMMPDMDGYQVCEKLKADEKTKNIPIIIFTADKDEAEKMMKIYKDIGAVDYVRKPFELRILLEKIDELINK
ncbi:MAG: two-component system response regulator [Candidatus Omnitrophica bacterium CG07_land_8_20_14_0_80_42_15]|uniref:Two-component system response regulator n=1 Tax=Candidatus Aquitaenariimonas noxiae TaxID=1974741 RepID=A0A2J0KWQ1_9BACT|nr:MAG: two-component system response regulator [Candidatus Omnitrophica bacterium CG07_land_8_20_14_0_80_42_15]